MKIDFQKIVEGLLLGLGAGFGYALALFLLEKF
jgi:hypothetical protein